MTSSLRIAPALATFLLIGALTGSPGEAKPLAKPATSGSEPRLVGQYGAWGAYAATQNGKSVCFVLAKPTKSQTNPPGRSRDPAYLFISTRPAERVRNEVSAMMGYPLKASSDVTFEVGNAHFAMYTQGDGAWIKNAAEEPALVEALRKGADVTVKGISTRGTETTDVYSLKGISQALDRVAQDCK